jgi:hypothetical protein
MGKGVYREYCLLTRYYDDSMLYGYGEKPKVFRPETPARTYEKEV